MVTVISKLLSPRGRHLMMIYSLLTMIISMLYQHVKIHAYVKSHTEMPCILNGVHIAKRVKSALVTGAAGVLGMYMSRYLLKCGVNDTVLMDEFNAESSIYMKRLRSAALETENNFSHIVHQRHLCYELKRFTYYSHYFFFDEGVPVDCLQQMMEKIATTYKSSKVFYLLYDVEDRDMTLRGIGDLTSSEHKYSTAMQRMIVAQRVFKMHNFVSYGVDFSSTKRRDSADKVVSTYGSFPVKLYGPHSSLSQEVSSLSLSMMNHNLIYLRNGGKEERRYMYVTDAVQYILSVIASSLSPHRPVIVDYSSKIGTIVSQKGLVRELEQVQQTHARIYLVNESGSIQFERTANHAPILRDFQMVQGALRQSTPLLNGLKAHVDWVQSYYRQLYPCASECASTGLCFNSAWDETMRLSTLATNGCDAVVYLVATGRLVDDLHLVGTSWYRIVDRSRLCNIAFVSGDSILYKSSATVDSQSYHWKTRNGWLLLPVGELDSFADPRKASRVPKLSPGRFFASSVRYAIYMDVKLVWKCDPGLLLQLMSGEYITPWKEQNNLQDLEYSHFLRNDTKLNWTEQHEMLLPWQHVKNNKKPLGFLAIYFSPNRNDVFGDFEHIKQLSHGWRKNITYYPELLEQQRMAYDEEKKKYGIDFKDLFEGALLVHDLHSSSSKRFRCMWYEEYQKWCDRDQLSGAYAWAWQHWLSSPHGDGKGSSLISLGTDEGGRVMYGRLLDRVYHWRADVNYTEGDWHKTALIVDLDHLSFDGHSRVINDTSSLLSQNF